MDEQKNLPCVRCGYIFKDPQYSAVACRLLPTNEPPKSVDDNDEAAFICGEMKHGHKMLASIDEDIEALQVMFDSLQEKRALVKKFIRDHAVILSPFRRIRFPPEVLTEIFHFAEPVADTSVHGGIWRFGRVCSYWRSVLLSSPFLWSTMLVRWSRPRIIEEMLSRSGNLLLDITLGDKWFKPTTEVASSVIHTVITASLRWRHITFHIPKPVLPLLSQLKGRVPMLVELEYNGLTFPEWLEGAPSLRKLNVRLLRPLSPQVLNLGLPWSNLCDCDVRPLTLQQEHRLLRQCPNLQTYTMKVDQTDPVPSDMLCLSELRKLILEHYTHTTTSLGFLILPHLDHVVLRVHYIMEQHFISSLHNLLTRSQCFPSKLDIPSDYITVIKFVSLVPFQNLTTLDVTCRSGGLSTLLPVLTVGPESSSVLLPQLERLHLRFFHSGLTVKDVELLIEMVRSRWHSHESIGLSNRLAFFEFRVDHDTSLSGALAPLLVFRDEGLELHVDEFYLRRSLATYWEYD